MPFLSWLLLGRSATGVLEKSVGDALNAVVPSVLAFRAAAALRPPQIDLGAISLPALYLRAMKDRLLGRSAGDNVRSSLPHCILRDIDGPHLLLQAAPEACVRAIEEFVRSLDITP